MYVEKVYVYLVLGMMLLMLFRMWRNERRLNQVEQFMSLVGKHGLDVDKTVRALIDVMERFFQGFRESIEKGKERANERRAERDNEGQDQ